jgi:hypothetical protein
VSTFKAKLFARVAARSGRTPNWRILLAVGFALVTSSIGMLIASGPATAQRNSGVELSAAQVVAAFEAAELPVERLRRDPLETGGPSGPPQTEREAWSFEIPSIAPSGGRILVFGDNERLRQKVAWFRRAGAEGKITVHENIVLWLNEELDPPVAARYRQALQELGR